MEKNGSLVLRSCRNEWERWIGETGRVTRKDEKENKYKKRVTSFFNILHEWLGRTGRKNRLANSNILQEWLGRKSRKIERVASNNILGE